MGNMSYCKFENTLSDLRQCYEYWDDCESESEKSARKRLYNLCQQITEDIDCEDN